MSTPEVEHDAAVAGPEPGTDEWAIETGSYIDPEPEEETEPYYDHAHGVAYYDTQAGYEAGLERFPVYQHVPPPGLDSEPEAGS